MASRSLPLALAGLLVATAALPSNASAQQEVETDDLPPYAAQELEAAWSADSDPVAQARAIPPPGGARVEAVPEQSRDRGDVGFDDFYHGLADHGTWVETPEYGYVFIPYRQTQVREWRPYVYGRWIWTNYGWTWVSEEPFGWATYHYGRWTFLPSFGWAWVPGYTWGPAWVAWRYSGTAIGWAPLYPGYVSWTAAYPVYTSHWVFIGPSYFYAHPVHVHHYHYRYSSRYYRETRWAPHWSSGRGAGYVYAGPPRSYVAERSRTPVRTTALQAAGRPDELRRNLAPGRAPDQIPVYRPEAARVRPAELAGRRGVEAPRNARVPDNVGSGLVAPRNGARLGDDGRMRSPDAPRGDPRGIRSPEAPRLPERAIPSGPRVDPVPPRGATPQGPRVDPVPPRGATPRAPRVDPAPPRGSAPEAPRVNPVPPRGGSREAPRVNPVPPQQTAPRVAPTPQGQSAPRVNPVPPQQTAPRVAPTPQGQSAPRVNPAPPRQTPPAPRVNPAPPRQSIAPQGSAAPRVRQAPQREASQERVRSAARMESTHAPRVSLAPPVQVAPRQPSVQRSSRERSGAAVRGTPVRTDRNR